MIEGISHITFVVQDLDRMEEILTTVLGAKIVYNSGDDTFSISREKFFLVGNVWVVAMEGKPLSEQTYNHVAFKIDEADYDNCFANVKKLGLQIRESRPRIQGEARSIYFYDYDNHLFELHTGTLDERLKSYKAKNNSH